MWHTFSQLNNYRTLNKLQDIAIIVGNAKYPAHKVVLATHSEYFERLFSDPGFKKRAPAEVALNHTVIKPDEFEKVLHYIYTTDITITFDNIYEIFVTARVLEMKMLLKMCLDVLGRYDVHTCLKALYIAERIGLKDIRREIYEFIMENFIEVSNTKQFLQYPADLLSSLLGSDDLNVDHEIQVFHPALKWIEHNQRDSAGIATMLLKQIRFGLMTPEELVQNVESNRLVMDIPACYILVLRAFRYLLLRDSELKCGMRPSPVNPRKGMNKDYHSRLTSATGGVSSPSHMTTLQEKIKHPVSVDEKYIFSVGGVCKQETFDSTGRAVNMYDPEANQWTLLTKLPRPRSHHAIQVMGKCLYVIGGSDPYDNKDGKFMSPTSTSYKYDIVKNKWFEISPMTTARVFFQAAVLEDHIYVVGGQGSKGSVLSSVEKYNPRTNTWHLVCPLSSPRYATALSAHQGFLYAVGGFCEDVKSPVMANVECYDPQQDRWFQRNPLRSARCHASLAEAQGRLFIFGGMTKTNYMSNDSRSLSNVDMYKDAEDAWESVTDLPKARHEAGICVVGVKIYILGGIDAAEKRILSSVECYDVSSGVWQHPSPAALPTPIFGHSCHTMPKKVQ